MRRSILKWPVLAKFVGSTFVGPLRIKVVVVVTGWLNWNYGSKVFRKKKLCLTWQDYFGAQISRQWLTSFCCVFIQLQLVVDVKLEFELESKRKKFEERRETKWRLWAELESPFSSWSWIGSRVRVVSYHCFAFVSFDVSIESDC